MRVVLATVPVLWTSLAMGQSPAIDTTKVYVSDPAACEALEKQGLGAFETLDFLTFSLANGIQGNEFNCQFFDVKSRTGNDITLIEAICEAPGERYPDLMSVAPNDEMQIEVVSMADQHLPGAEGRENPGVTLYSRCDNLSELPR